MRSGVYNYQTIEETAIQPRKISANNIKIIVDEIDQTLTIENVDEDGKRRRKTDLFYRCKETKKLPKYVRENNLYKEIKCKLIDGKVEVIWPEHKDKAPTTEVQEVGEDIPIEIIDGAYIIEQKRLAKERLEKDKQEIRELQQKRRKEKEKYERRNSHLPENQIAEFLRKKDVEIMGGELDEENNEETQGDEQANVDCGDQANFVIEEE